MREEIKKLISNRNLLEAIQQLKDKASDEEIEHALIVLAGDLQDVERGYNDERIQFDEYKRQKTIISHRILSYVERIDKENIPSFRSIFTGVWVRLKWVQKNADFYYDFDEYYVDFGEDLEKWSGNSLSFIEKRMHFDEYENKVTFIFDNIESGCGKVIFRPHIFNYEQKDYPAKAMLVYIDYDYRLTTRIIRIMNMMGEEQFVYVKIMNLEGFNRFLYSKISETTPEGQSFEEFEKRMKNSL